MNHILSVSKRAILLNNRLPVQTAIRTVLNNREWRPREEVPVTLEDREATARKYNMLPEDYKSLPPEMNAGDMPDVPPTGVYLERSPWEDYDYPLERRFWNEPRHPMDFIKYDKSRQNFSDEKVSVGPVTWLKLIALPVGIALLFYICHPLELMTPTFKSQRVTTGVVHYSFEKDDGSGRGVRY